MYHYYGYDYCTLICFWKKHIYFCCTFCHLYNHTLYILDHQTILTWGFHAAIQSYYCLFQVPWLRLGTLFNLVPWIHFVQSALSHFNFENIIWIWDHSPYEASGVAPVSINTRDRNSYCISKWNCSNFCMRPPSLPFCFQCLRFPSPPTLNFY